MNLGRIGSFHDADLIEGRAAPVDREAQRREQRMRLAMKSTWPELPRADLNIGRFHIEDMRTGELYEVVRGEIDSRHTPACAYYIAGDDVVFLERHAARTVDALAAQRAAREDARAERMRPRSRP